MSGNLSVGSWVVIRKGCPITYRVNGRDEVEFRFGSQWDGFEFVFDAAVVREFRRVSKLALDDVANQQLSGPEPTTR